MSARTRTEVAVVFSVGNTSLFCGAARNGRIEQSFRVPLAEIDTDRAFATKVAPRLPATATAAAFCSVVPAQTKVTARRIRQLYGLVPRQLTAAATTGIDIRYRDPAELGTDRLASAMGARHLYPRRDLIIVDCGTATTITALDRRGRLLGGAILPGVALWSRLLAEGTAQLPTTRIEIPRSPVGRSTREAIESGLYHGHAGAIRELVGRVSRQAFPHTKPVVLGTGGNAALFNREMLFAKIEPGLILTGLTVFALPPTRSS